MNERIAIFPKDLYKQMGPKHHNSKEEKYYYLSNLLAKKIKINSYPNSNNKVPSLFGNYLILEQNPSQGDLSIHTRA